MLAEIPCGDLAAGDEFDAIDASLLSSAYADHHAAVTEPTLLLRVYMTQMLARIRSRKSWDCHGTTWPGSKNDAPVMSFWHQHWYRFYDHREESVTHDSEAPNLPNLD
jgi:hypothetical protein